MPTLLLLVLAILIRLCPATPCIALDSPGPFVVSLTNGSASLTLNASLCPNSSLTVSAVPKRLTPSVSVKPLSKAPDECSVLRTTLAFQSRTGSGKLVFATSKCTISVPIVVAGVEAYQLPSRDFVTSVGADPVRISAPRREPTRVFFAVKTVIATGKTFRARKAATALEVKLSPPIPSVNVSLGIGNHRGNLQILSADDGSDVPRTHRTQTVTLRLAGSDISAFFRIVHAPLVATIRAVRAPARLSPTGGERIVLLVRRAAAEQRRLVIGNVTVLETEYVRRDANFLSIFISPPLPWGRHEWRMELVTGSNVTVARDASGHIFKVAEIPMLTSILPTIAKPQTDGFVIFTGTFEGSVRVFVDGKAIPVGDIMHKASGEVIMRLPEVASTFNGTVSVTVKSARGSESNALALKFDPDAIYVHAVVAHASTNPSNGRFEIPFLCNRSETPVIIARADTSQEVYDLPSFKFSIRTSASGLDFEDLPDTSSGMVSLDANLFEEDSELVNSFVAVRIFVSQQEHSGETIIFISRLLRRDVIGVTVLPPFEAQRGFGHDVLEAQVTPLGHCRNATNLETLTTWSINNRPIISNDVNDSKGLQDGKPVVTGFGRTVVVPNNPDFSYFATVSVTNKSTGDIVATGTSNKSGRLGALRIPLRTFLNNGLGSITLPSGIERYEIHSAVYDVDSVIPPSRVQYSWVCQSLTPDSSKCPEALFPVEVAGSRIAAGFNVTTIGVKEEIEVEYRLTVRSGAHQLGNARLRLSVSLGEVAAFPPSKIFAGASLPDVMADGSIQFACYQHIIVAILDPRMTGTYRFALFHEGNDTDILETFGDDILIAHSGYWSSQNHEGIVFGILPHKLEAGNYTLYGARDKAAEQGSGASWTFRIRSCPILMPYKLPLLSGTAGLTTFFAGATSMPPSRNMFFFELTKQKDGDPASDTNSTVYLPECSGGELCAFSVPIAGHYFLRIDMYDPSGTRKLSSKSLETQLTVFERNTTDSDSGFTDSNSTTHSEAVGAALLHKDKGAFIRSVVQLSPQEPVETSVLKESIQGLQNLSSDPTLVPVRGNLVLAACSHLMLFDQNRHDVDKINQLRRVVETTITNSVSNDGPATALQGPAVRFYSILRQESSSFVGSQSDKDNTTVSSEVEEIARLSAGLHLPVILSVGRECGFIDQLVVNYPSQTRVNVSSGAPMVAKSDDYRIGIKCFSGQVERLLPEPVTAEVCLDSNSTGRFFATPQVLVSAEQDDLTSESSETELLSGPTMQTRVMRLKRVNNSILMEDDNRSKPGCYRTRVSVYVSKDLAEHLLPSTREHIDISCEAGKLPVSSLHIEGQDIEQPDSQAFIIGSDGRVSMYMEASPPISASMTVNGTRLRECIAVPRLEGNEGSSTSTVILSILGAAGVLLIIVIALLVGRHYQQRDKFSVPESLAPWDSVDMSQPRTRSTLSSFYYESGELHHVENRWEGEFRQVQQGGSKGSQRGFGTEGDEAKEVVERRRTGNISGSIRESWEPLSDSRLSSLLTATDSYTTSSGGNSSYGASSRAKRLARMNRLPGTSSSTTSSGDYNSSGPSNRTRLQAGMHRLPRFYASSATRAKELPSR